MRILPALQSLGPLVLVLLTMAVPRESFAESPVSGPEPAPPVPAAVDSLKVAASPGVFDIFWREDKTRIALPSVSNVAPYSVHAREFCNTGLQGVAEVGYDVVTNGFGEHRVVYSGGAGSEVRSSSDREASGCRGNDRDQKSLAPGVRLSRAHSGYTSESFFSVSPNSVDAFVVPVALSGDDQRQTASVRFLRGNRDDIRPSFVATSPSSLFLVATETALQGVRFDTKSLRPIDAVPRALVLGPVDHAIASETREGFRVVYSSNGELAEGLLSYTEDAFASHRIPGFGGPVRLLDGCTDPGVQGIINAFAIEDIYADGSPGAVYLQRTLPRDIDTAPLSFDSTVRVFDRKTGPVAVDCVNGVCVVAMAGTDTIALRRVSGAQVDVLNPAVVSTHPASGAGVSNEKTMADGARASASGCSTRPGSSSTGILGGIVTLIVGVIAARRRRSLE